METHKEKTSFRIDYANNDATVDAYLKKSATSRTLAFAHSGGFLVFVLAALTADVSERARLFLVLAAALSTVAGMGACSVWMDLRKSAWIRTLELRVAALEGPQPEEGE